MTEKRLLQAAIALASLVPILAGLAGIIGGPFVFGATNYSTDTISHTAYLSGLLLGMGLAFVASIRNVERHRGRFVLLGAIVVIGGLARLYAGLLTGFGTWPHRAALVMELVVTPAIVFWQMRVSRKLASR